MIDDKKQFITRVLFNELHQAIPLNKKFAIIVKIFGDYYVSVFNSHDFFIQINHSNWNHLLLALFIKQEWLQKRV